MDVSKPASGSPARQRIAANLRRLRRERGLSQEAMAEQAEFHRTYVSQLERCVTNISIDGLERLAHALGVDIQALLAAETAPDDPPHDGYHRPTQQPGLAVHEASPAFAQGMAPTPAEAPALAQPTPRKKRPDTL